MAPASERGLRGKLLHRLTLARPAAQPQRSFIAKSACCSGITRKSAGAMKKQWTNSLLALCALTALASPGVYAQELPADPDASQVESDLRKNYARKYAGSKIETATAAGEGVLLEKKDAKGKTVEVKRKFPFQVTATKGKRKFEYEIGVNYKLVKNRWVFSELAVGAAKEIAGADQAAPDKAQVKKLFAAAVSAEKFDGKKVDGVLLTDPEFAGGAYRYNAEFKVEGSQKCTDWDFILRQEGGSWKVTDIMRGRCN
jgi:hypothetical protein